MGYYEDYGHVPPCFARTLRDTDVERDVEYLQQQRNEAALNYDGGKLRYDLIPADAMEFFTPLVFEGKITGEADKWVFRSEAGWRVTFTEPQLNDYKVEV